VRLYTHTNRCATRIASGARRTDGRCEVGAAVVDATLHIQSGREHARAFNLHSTSRRHSRPACAPYTSITQHQHTTSPSSLTFASPRHDRHAEKERKRSKKKEKNDDLK
jgi:hypothetical protein